MSTKNKNYLIKNYLIRLFQVCGLTVFMAFSLGCSDVKFSSKASTPCPQGDPSCDPSGSGDKVPDPPSGPSPTYAWHTGDYSNCSKACGGGAQTRTVACRRNDGKNVEDSHCASQPKPESSRACNTHSCQVATWVTGEYGACSKACDGGTQSRSVTCQLGGQPVAESSCTGTKPVTQQACNTQACQYTYSWLVGQYGACSKTCGGGTQTRSVICRRNDGQNVADQLCAQPKPGTQQACNTQACSPGFKTVTTTEKVATVTRQVDILVIVDDSSSMTPDNLKLAGRMVGFFTDLEAANLDYQVCITTTDVDYYKGAPIQWEGLGTAVLSRSSPNKGKVFTDTINKIGSGWSNDEQGIKAMNLMLSNFTQSGCFRSQADVAVILVSEEDERSVGGQFHLSEVQYRPLTPANQPSNLIGNFSARFPHKHLIWNSIIVVPGDYSCEAEQDRQISPSFPGVLYRNLSNLTQGHVGSICASDYTTNLRFIKDRIAAQKSLQLECAPQQVQNVSITPTFSTQVTLSGNKLQFNPAVPEGRTISATYQCPN